MTMLPASGKWRQYRTAILGTLAAAGIWLAAILAQQPTVTPPPLPLASCGARQWVTTAAYTGTVEGITVIVPSGFTNDLASIPGPAQEAIGITRDHPAIRRGALFHDWIYRTKEWPRETADLVLYYACLDDGMDKDKARAVLKAVQLWGWLAWERSR
jgi:hypothetical protein